MPTRLTSVAVLSISVLAATFHLYAAGFSPFTALVQRPVHLGLMALLAFLGVGLLKNPVAAGELLGDDASATRSPDAGGVTPLMRNVVSAVLAAATVFVCGYMVLQHNTLVLRSGSPTSLDLIAGALAIVLVLELARRTTGWGLVVVALLALFYSWAGPWMPGILAHRGYPPTRVIEHLYLSTEGIWGIPLGVSADFVYLFVLFGVILESAGGGQLLIALAARVAGKSRGGPAKTAVVASALMGSLSGSAVANVATTGTVTIPLMKRAGFTPQFAAAVEAVASTGGQFMPPVMGAGAFILSTWTNIPYLTVALAALVPAMLYYVALFAMIHFRAERDDLPRSHTGDGNTAARLHLLIPLLVIVALLAMGRSPMRAAFWGVISAFVAAALARTTRLNGAQLAGALRSAGAGTVQVAAACATAGIVVGVASLTGIGLRMSELIVTLSQGNLALALMLTALGSLVLGMGLPTTAAYVVLAALGAPALTELGVPLLAAHLFIFYFGCISNITPPVALAAYTAAGIAESRPLPTAITAMALGSTGFIIPFLFVYGPPLLLIGSPVQVILAIASAVAGVVALGAAVAGFARTPLKVWERVALTVAAISLIFPGTKTDMAGLILIGVIVFRKRKGTT